MWYGARSKKSDWQLPTRIIVYPTLCLPADDTCLSTYKTVEPCAMKQDGSGKGTGTWRVRTCQAIESNVVINQHNDLRSPPSVFQTIHSTSTLPRFRVPPKRCSYRRS
jgi:hypothetical protein